MLLWLSIDTVNWPLSLGSAAAESFAKMLTRAVSPSSVIVTVSLFGAPMLMLASPLVMPVNVTVTVSSASTRLSSITLTSIVVELVLAVMVTLPLRAV